MHKLRFAIDPQERIFLFLDNLRLHQTYYVMTEAAKLNIEIVFNGTYSSEYMPVEILWGYAKRLFSNACVQGASYEDQNRME